MMKYTRNFAILLIISFFILNLSARNLEEIKQSGKLYVGFDQTDLGTINHTLAYEMADFLNLQLVEVVVDWDKLFQKDGIRPKDLETNPAVIYTPDAFDEVDIYCSTISPLLWRKKLFDFAETLLSAEVLLIRNDIENIPKDIYQLQGLQIGLMDGTSFVSHLEVIDAKIGGGIIMIKTIDGASTKQLLIDKKVDGIILDAEDALQFNKENNQNFIIAFPINKVSKTVWAVEKGNSLRYDVANFFKAIENNGFLDQLYQLKYSATYSSFAENLVPHTPIQIYHRDLEEILTSKKLVIALRERDFIFHKNGSKQFMHILAEEFAEYLGVKLEYVLINGSGAYWQDENGIVKKDSSYNPEIFNYFDIAVDIFAQLPWRESKVNLIPIYETNFSVLAKPDKDINSISDLHHFHGVTADNSLYQDLLEEEGISNFYHARANDMVSEVRKGQADYTLILNSFLYPDLETKISLGSVNINWATRKDQPQLKNAIEQFIKESSNNGLLSTLSKIARGASFNTIDDFMKSYYESSQPGTLPHILVGAEEGLPQEDVRSIFQDSKGYLWFGTLSGIVRYNGRKMDQWNTTNGLVHNTVYDITEDINGDLFIATEKGISQIKNSGEFVNYPSNSSFKQIYIDQNNKKWLISENGLFLLKGQKIIPGENPFDLPENGGINGMCQDTSANYYFIAAKNGLYLIHDNAWSRLSDKEIYSVFVDKNNKIWYASANGLFYLPVPSLVAKQTPQMLNEQLDMPKTPINGISQSKSGSIWLKNSTHLYQVISPQQKAIQYSSGSDLLNNFILSYAQDSEENLWIGYSGGLQRIINNKNIRNLFPETLNSYIASVMKDPLGNMWISTNKWVYRYNTQNNQLENISKKLGLKLGMGLIKPLANTHYS